MELISQILFALSPFMVSGLTQLFKPSKTTPLFGYRKIITRFGVALLSFGAVVGTAYLANQEVGAVTFETFVQAFIIFVGATGTYFWAKYKKASV